jgi:hypothetical protein
MAPCRSCVNRRFGGTYRLHLQGRNICQRGSSVCRLLQTDSATCSPGLSTWSLQTLPLSSIDFPCVHSPSLPPTHCSYIAECFRLVAQSASHLPTLIPRSPTSALAEGKWSASHPGRFTPGERAPGTNWMGDWVSPKTGLDDVGKRKILPLPGLELRPLGHQARNQSIYWLSYPGSKITW